MGRSSFLDHAPLAFTVPRSRVSELLKLENNIDLYQDLRDGVNTPGATEIDDDDNDILDVFRLDAKPHRRPRVRYNRKRSRDGEDCHCDKIGPVVNRGYVFGSEEGCCDFYLPHYASGIHFRVYLNDHKIWMVRDESKNGTTVNGDRVSSARARARAWHVVDETMGFKDQVALNSNLDFLNTIKINDLVLTMWVVHPTEDQPSGLAQSMVLPDDDPPSSELLRSSCPSRSNPTPIVPSRRPSIGELRPRREYYELGNFEPIASRGEAKRLIRRSTGTPVIGKFYNEDEEVIAQERYAMLKAISQSTCRKAHILNYIDANNTDFDQYFVVTDDLRAHSLDERLHMQDPLSKTSLVVMLIQLMTALKFLASVDIIHRDIEPKTILWYEEPGKGAMLTGFSESRQCTTSSGLVGHPDFRAPEVTENTLYDAKVDVYALCTVVLSHPPPADSTEEQLNLEILRLLDLGLEKQPTARYSASRMCDTIRDCMGNKSGPPFLSFFCGKAFELQCCSTRKDFFVREASLWRVVQSCFNVSKKDYQSQIRKDYKTWPTDVSFKVARKFFPSNVLSPSNEELELDLRDDGPPMQIHLQKPQEFTLCYTHAYEIYYHTLSHLINVTQLLKAADLRPDECILEPHYIQEVYGSAEFEGTYIDAKCFRRLWEQVDDRCKKCHLGPSDPSSVIDQLCSAGLHSAKNPIHRERFMNTDYMEYVIVFSGWRMILVKRKDGSANLHHIQAPESAWQKTSTSEYAPTGAAAAAFEKQGLIETANIVRKLGAQIPLCVFPNYRRKSSNEKLPTNKGLSYGSLASCSEASDGPKKVNQWLSGWV